MLHVHSLQKTFGKKVILDKISFTIKANEIVGMIGPNGSGKTTLLNILMGMFRPTSGTFSYDENTHLGMAVSRKGFFDDMKVRDNILTYAEMHKVSPDKVDKLLKEFQIDFGAVTFNRLSAGMKQRVSLLMAFLFDSNLILLDEPSNHLDIDSLLILRNKLLDERSKGKSFLVTSHILTDLERICNRILFLKNGTLMMDRYTDDILHEFGSLEDAYLNLKLS